MAMENKRITQLSTERLNLTSGDYVMVDDADNGSAKYRLDRLKETDNTLSVSGMAADAAATGQAISDEAEARANADNALDEDIGDLKSALSNLWRSENSSKVILSETLRATATTSVTTLFENVIPAGQYNKGLYVMVGNVIGTEGTLTDVGYIRVFYTDSSYNTTIIHDPYVEYIVTINQSKTVSSIAFVGYRKAESSSTTLTTSWEVVMYERNRILEISKIQESYLAPILFGASGCAAIVNTTNKTITFPSDSLLIHNYFNVGKYIPIGNAAISYSGASSSAIKLIYNLDTSEFAVYNYNAEIPDNCLLVATIRDDGNNTTVNMTCPVIVDGKFQNLNMDDYVPQYVNLFNELTKVQGYLDASGNISGQSPDNREFTSDFIRLIPGHDLWMYYNPTVPSGKTAYFSLCLYDSSKTLIGTRRGGTVSTLPLSMLLSDWLTIPSNAAYIRVSGRYFDSETANITVAYGNKQDVPLPSPFTQTNNIINSASENVFRELEKVAGFLRTNGQVDSPSKEKEWTSPFIPVKAGSLISLAYNPTVPVGKTAWFVYVWYNSSKEMIGSRVGGNLSTLPYYYGHIVVPENAAYIRVSGKYFDSETANICVCLTPEIPFYKRSSTDALIPYFNQIEYDRKRITLPSIVKGVGHRGCTGTPENSLLGAFNCRDKGFSAMETDVQSTSDGVFVLLHDPTINRTARNADGTEISENVYIDQITYEQALEYDFGISYDSKFAGTKIPKLEDFLKVCRSIGLDVHLEIKNEHNGLTQNQVNAIVDMVHRCGMKGHVIYESSDPAYLEYVVAKTQDEKWGRICSPTSENISSIMTSMATLSQSNPNGLISAGYVGLTDSIVETIISGGYPLAAWTIDLASEMISLDPYVTYVISNARNVADVLYDNEMT